uniref:MFS domain-containing protein n=1 Tax=Heterorhabditis bacteriophora TaxID=37862 RepID=A0A1I7X3F2_HETBA
MNVRSPNILYKKMGAQRATAHFDGDGIHFYFKYRFASLRWNSLIFLKILNSTKVLKNIFLLEFFFRLFCIGVVLASVLNVVVAFALQFHPFTDFIVMALQVIQGLALNEKTKINKYLTTVPWKTILLSPPVWAIVICNFCRSWTFFLLLGNQLTYMKDVLHIDIKHSGLISALPQLLMTCVVLISGQLADWLRSTGKMNTGPVRKMFNTMGFGGEALFLAFLAFIHDPTLAVVCLVIAATLSGMSIAGFNVNHFDIAPRYASILMGFSNGFGALAGMGGIITQNLTAENPGGWKYCFLLAMGVDIFGIIFYILFAKGEVQEWAQEPEPEETLGDFQSHAMRNTTKQMRESPYPTAQRWCGICPLGERPIFCRELLEETAKWTTLGNLCNYILKMLHNFHNLCLYLHSVKLFRETYIYKIDYVF